MNRRTLGRAYELILTVAVTSSVLYGVATSSIAVLLRAVDRSLGHSGLLALLALLASSAALAAFTRLGPLWASRVELLWRDPSALLRRRAWHYVVVSVSAAVSLGAVCAAASQRAGLGVDAGVVVAGTVGGGALVAWAAQRSDSARAVGGLGPVAGLGAVGLLCLNAGAVPSMVMVAGVGWVVLLALLGSRLPAASAWASSRRRAWRGLWQWRQPPARWELVRAGAFVDALMMSAIMLDGAPLELLRDSRLRPSRLRLPRNDSGVLLGRALSTARVAALVPLAALPAGVHVLLGASAAAATLTVLTYLFGWRVARSLDAYLDFVALRRTFALRRRRLQVLLVGSVVLPVVAYAGLAAAVASLPFGWVIACSAVALLGVLRRHSGRRLTGQAGALLSTPMGAIPMDLARRVVAGLDVAIVSTVIAWRGPAGPCAIAAVIALVGYAVLITSRGR